MIRRGLSDPKTIQATHNYLAYFSSTNKKLIIPLVDVHEWWVISFPRMVFLVFPPLTKFLLLSVFIYSADLVN